MDSFIFIFCGLSSRSSSSHQIWVGDISHVMTIVHNACSWFAAIAPRIASTFREICYCPSIAERVEWSFGHSFKSSSSRWYSCTSSKSNWHTNTKNLPQIFRLFLHGTGIIIVITVLLFGSLDVEHIVAAYQHFSQIPRQLTIDKLFRLLQLQIHVRITRC